MAVIVRPFAPNQRSAAIASRSRSRSAREISSSDGPPGAEVPLRS
jgi:hypothetical protein